MNLDPQCLYGSKAPLPFEKLVTQTSIRRQSLREMPIALPAQTCENRMIPRRTEFYQFADAFPRPAPLFPIAHADTTPQPMIHLNGIVILQGDTEVIHPSLKIGTGFIIPVIHRNTPTAPRKTTQFRFEACEDLSETVRTRRNES